MTGDFYDRPVLDVAADMVGCRLVHGDTAGIIVETEAYHMSEAACHAYVGLTARTSVLFDSPGLAYVYRSYGIHWCMNMVGRRGSAVLIRALGPTAGFDAMQERRGLTDVRALCSGPGKLCQALAITGDHDGLALDAPPFQVLPRMTEPDLVVGPRIGITKAVDQPWRFGLKGSRYVSRPFR